MRNIIWTILASLLLSSCKSSNNRIFVTAYPKLLHQTPKDKLFEYFDYRYNGYGVKSEDDTSKCLVEPIFDAISIDEKGLIKLFYNRSKIHKHPTSILIGRCIASDGNISIFFLNPAGYLDYGCEYEIGNSYGPDINRIPVKNNTLWGFITRDRELCIPYQFDLVEIIRDNMILASQHNKVGLIDTLGNLLLPFDYDNIDFPIFFKEGKYGVFNERLEKIVTDLDEAQTIYDESTNKVYYSGNRGHTYFLFNSNGEVIFEVEYRQIIGIDDYVITIASEIGKNEIYYSLMTKSFFGHQFENASSAHHTFKYGNAIVDNKNKFGVINRQGDIVIPLEYDRISIGINYLLSSKDQQSYIFDRNGKLLKTIPFPGIEFLNSRYQNLFYVSSATGLALVDLDGNLLSEPKYADTFTIDGNKLTLFGTDGYACIFNLSNRKNIYKYKYDR